MLIVAAVGNDGPAAPPAYPASYKGVFAVTGVNARNRALPEAGRALHIDFAAPGDAVLAATSIDATDRLRGTSFAAPLVAGRSEEHTSELQALMRHSYPVFCLKKTTS